MTAKEQQLIDFSTVLAAAVHDMKSSLNLLQQSIDGLNKTITADNHSAQQFLSTAHYESSRLNTGLVQLLSLYRAEMENLPINEDECFIDDLLENIFITHEHYLGHRNMTLEIEQTPGLVRYLDQDLITLLLNDILVNAIRYGSKKLRVSAYEQDDWLYIKVEDDGEGYPCKMLANNELKMQDFKISNGRTGLGLFFARLIASAHRRGDKKGEIALSNGGNLGGSVFTLKLP
ncbi:HAMP domain-containing sensor histidine kinase [Aliiglaciecola sp. 2_MG-2023]|uniref:sensor histidine kinase n=1 Tax=Alteromonadaceae TaxID=72275 RepID=UPI0026E19BEA|nr:MULTISPECIES: HAMP domain-containing sensor histidine kinase [unclassified Aliiglaciecola]MDO6712182.1 HAMP domain-containing sensor histidine kinase [Aliiglaciecola sp. 2_MG-2023]MDO6753580.1 HAMP domain-containing sensor histidine kinase [Aliiglaciecola sp. 1_MG-2023]